METLLRYGLLAVFIALILTPLGLPVPEDVSLLVAGVLAGSGHVPLAWAIAVGWSGVILGDCISWTYGRYFGLHPTGFVSRLVGPEQIERIERFYRRYGTWAIVIARQVPGMRLPAFFFAGATGVSLPRFVLVDGSAALFTASVYVLVGWTFADDIEQVVPWLDRFRTVGGFVLLAAIVVLLWRRWRRHKRRKQQRLDRQPPPQD